MQTQKMGKSVEQKQPDEQEVQEYIIKLLSTRIRDEKIFSTDNCKQEESVVIMEKPSEEFLPRHVLLNNQRVNKERISLDDISSDVVDTVVDLIIDWNERATSVLTLTYQQYLTTDQLLDILFNMYSSSDLNSSRVNIIRIIEQWMKRYYLHFNRFECSGFTTRVESVARIERFIQDRKKNLEGIESLEDIHEAFCSLETCMTTAYQEAMDRRVPAVDKLLHFCVSHTVWSQFVYIRTLTLFQKQIELENIDCKLAARHLTLIDYCYFATIQPQEFLNLHWSKAKYKYRSPNILKVIKRFNDFSSWIAALIVIPESIERRVKRVKWFISFAYELSLLNNFNAVQAILGMYEEQNEIWFVSNHGLATFRFTPVSRLKATFNQLSDQDNLQLQNLKTSMSKDSNYSKLRSILQSTRQTIKNELQVDNRDQKSVTICIPFLGMFLTDLTFIEEGNQETHFFTRSELVYDLIEMIMTFQHTTWEQNARETCHSLIKQGGALDSNLLLYMHSMPEKLKNEDDLVTLSKLREQS